MSTYEPIYVGLPSIRSNNKINNPIITKEIVSDRLNSIGVADPFIVYENGIYHMFFEVLSGENPDTGEVEDEIGHAWSIDLQNWNYTQIVLSKELFGHRSAYPNVFKYNNEWYMIPDTVGDIKVYKAKKFPLEWEFSIDLIKGHFVDTNIFQYSGVWFLTTSQMKSGSFDEVLLFYNTSGDWRNTSWIKHPKGIIIPTNYDEQGLRNAGTPMINHDSVIMPIQVTPKDTGQYGECVYWYKLTNLTVDSCDVTRLSKAMTAEYNGGWNSNSMHHISHVAHKHHYIYAVDGLKDNEYSIGLYMDGTQLIACSATVLTSSVPIAEWTPISLKRGEYDTFGLLDRKTHQLHIATTGYYLFNIQIGNSDSQFRILLDDHILFTSMLCSHSTILYINTPGTIKIEVLAKVNDHIDISTSHVDCLKL